MVTPEPIPGSHGGGQVGIHFEGDVGPLQRTMRTHSHLVVIQSH